MPNPDPVIRSPSSAGLSYVDVPEMTVPLEPLTEDPVQPLEPEGHAVEVPPGSAAPPPNITFRSSYTSHSSFGNPQFTLLPLNQLNAPSGGRKAGPPVSEPRDVPSGTAPSTTPATFVPQ